MTATPTTTASAPERDRDGDHPWARLLAVATAVVAAVDLAFFAVIREVIPPLAVGAALTVVGIVLLRSRRRAGIVVLALTSVVMLGGSIEFGVAHLGHPESGVDWTHAVVGIVGRVVALAAAVAAWRGAGAATARRTGVVAIGALAAVVTVALVATVATSGEEAEPDDVVVVVERTTFPEDLVLDAGTVAFVDNRDIFRHTFTVEGTGIDVELPARQGVRVPVELERGTYQLVCEIPGHDSMTGTLTVR